MIEIRPYSKEIPVNAITSLLHKAYRRLADLGLRYSATWQGDDLTAERLGKGSTYLAFANSSLVGTITLEDQRVTQGCPWYDLPYVASFHQFAVDPDFQGQGIGKLLVEKVEHEACTLGVTELALDTAERAYHLIDRYFSWGYRIVGEAQWETTNYLSVILSKNLNSSSFQTSTTMSMKFLRDKPSQEFADKISELEQALADSATKEIRANFLGLIGDYYRMQGNYNRALNSLELAMGISMQSKTQLFVNRLRMAITYQYAGKSDISRFIFRQLLRDVSNGSALNSHIDYLHQHYGKFLVEQGEFIEAMNHLDIAKGIRTRGQAASSLLQSTNEAIQALNELLS